MRFSHHTTESPTMRAGASRPGSPLLPGDRLRTAGGTGGPKFSKEPGSPDTQDDCEVWRPPCRRAFFTYAPRHAARIIAGKGQRAKGWGCRPRPPEHTMRAKQGFAGSHFLRRVAGYAQRIPALETHNSMSGCKCPANMEDAAMK